MTSRYQHFADAVLLKAADAVADETARLMGCDETGGNDNSARLLRRLPAHWGANHLAGELFKMIAGVEMLADLVLVRKILVCFSLFWSRSFAASARPPLASVRSAHFPIT